MTNGICKDPDQAADLHSLVRVFTDFIHMTFGASHKTEAQVGEGILYHM